MKQAGMLLMAGLAAGCVAQDPVGTAQTAQNRLGEALAGRTAGEPVDCVNLRELRGNRSVGDGAIVFEANRDIVYVNRPAGGCPSLEFGRTLVTRTTGGELCRGDIVTVFDPVSGTDFGGCGLGAFTPYRRTR